MITKVTSDLFKDLRNPYTGKPMEVEMTVNPGREPLFSCPGTYSTDDFFDTKEECIAAWDHKDGVAGLKRNLPIVCAYTNEPLALVQGCGGKWHFSGGFNPHMFFSRDEFLRLASMRGGVSGYCVPEACRVTAPARSARITGDRRNHAASMAPSLNEEKLHDLENRLNSRGIRVQPESVAVSNGRKRRRVK